LTRIVPLLAVFALLAAAQTPPPGEMSQAEQENLRLVLGEAGNSPVEFIRSVESHLQKYPASPKKPELERALFRATIETKDNRRLILYGERVLEREPSDLQALERVTVALLQTGDKPGVMRALKYAERFEKLIRDMAKQPAAGRDLVKQRDDLDRGTARALVLEARAHGLLDENGIAAALAEKSFQAYPSVEGAREAARWLSSSGKDAEAIRYLAEAFSIADLKAADPDAAHDRARMGELYRKLNGSEKGLGDLLLDAYDRTNSLFAARRLELRALDPNSQIKDPFEFTLSALEGNPLKLATLKGKVIVMDFWATWCGPCRGQHPLYEQVKTKFKNRDDIVFLAIDTDEDRSMVKPFLEAQDWSRKVYFEDGLQQLLQVSSIPTTLIFDKKGEMASRMIGFIPERFVDMLTARIQEALGAEPAVTHARR
jgi:thiol-disulfide isomerase/thioredoxin